MIYYECLNDDHLETMVLVHGLSQNGKIFDKQIDYFENKYNLLLIDIRGHGDSEKINGPYGVEEYTDDIEEIFKQESLKNIIYWGTHTGSAVGLNLYFRNSDYISTLILEGAVIPGCDTPGINKNIQKAKQNLLEHGIEEAIRVWLSESEWFEYTRKNPLKTRYTEQTEIINSFTGKPWGSSEIPKEPLNVYSKLEEIEIPILAYNGEHDMEEFLNMANILEKKALANKKIIPNAGGFPLWENPATVNSVVQSWLDNTRNHKIKPL